MDAMLQRHCAKYIYVVPEGLKELLSDISREVLRSQPIEIYTFIADYLDALLITRENARIAIRLVQSITEIAETTVQTLLDLGVTRLEADIIVSIIQKHFKQSAERKKKFEEELIGEGTDEELLTQAILNELNMSLEDLEKVAIIIQQAYRKFKERERLQKEMLFGMVDWRIAARSAIALYRKTGVTHYEANRAATLIKAAYKGYYTRRVMKRLLQQAVDDEFDFRAVSDDEDKDETETSRIGSAHTTNLSSFGDFGEQSTASFERVPYTEPGEDVTYPSDQYPSEFIAQDASEQEDDYYTEPPTLPNEVTYLEEEDIFGFDGLLENFGENIPAVRQDESPGE